ncbi:hypothetical protein NG799_01650 [Laspinema sp. D1]|uniref:Uncharacterized protein n=2 Tax=Laspinema TaxID=2584823 RepID=A0ABT2MJW7_9CYAN|nr:hypothetical protein [Laspinema sp. D3b]MCT7965035.1 hypothetical protein [Laspinema sp. D2a]MCT7977680.1 hypothetical protein [Laspinema sp. D3b]
MIIIPRKDELPEIESALEEYAKLKKTIQNSQDWLKEIEPKAINEALTILETGNSLNNKGKMVYRGNGLKLVLGARKKYPTDKDDPELERLSQQIQLFELAEIRKNSEELNQITEQIEFLRSQIEVLQAKQEELKQTAYIISLKSKYNDRRDKGMYQEPYLIVYQS